ncbi:hypothetical protein EJ05DRAFT_473339 [Pseudovirgaria hyperparasitica]|uniref:Serine protease n=1 Tax=Pseudovirgaria hyperparasitica TaxID=470096 RepID=A0A6A6WDR7_9PEZI|nr:uncharacterized protein EJ05DRAFT_473339 [Pseudovirgaria hyperparasitica]KAF2760715.1 hypothetical protein EJ05DRAFT_473339 [Pseudovirgaria hyperparasitica]
MSDPRVIAWELQDASYNPPIQKNTDSSSLVSTAAPSTSQLDETRELDVQPGGQYRAHTKLYINFSRTDDTAWRIATGFLITPSIIATAAHNVFALSPLAPAAQIKAYIGYRGSASVAERYTQFRSGKKTVIPEGWVTSRGAIRRDNVAFIQLDRPFEGVTCVRYAYAPGTGAGEVEVAGYAADREDPGTREFGGVVWSVNSNISYNLTREGLMSYTPIDSGGGLVGAPVLRTSDNYAIAVHAFGGAPNLAVPIGPKGHDFDAYIKALEGPLKPDQLFAFPLSTPEKSRSVDVADVARAFPKTSQSVWTTQGSTMIAWWAGYVAAGVMLARWLGRAKR